MNVEPDTMEAQLAKDRVRHSSRLEIDQAHGDKQQIAAAIGMQGAVVYAMLDVANALRSLRPDAQQDRLLSIMDSLVEAITEGADAAKVKELSDLYYIERQGFEIDQKNAMIPEMRGKAG